MVTMNSLGNAMLCKYRNESSNGFLGSVIFHFSDNYVTTESAGNNKVTITLEFKNVCCHSFPCFHATGY